MLIVGFGADRRYVAILCCQAKDSFDWKNQRQVLLRNTGNQPLPLHIIHIGR